MSKHYMGCSSVFPIILRGEGESREVLLHLRQNTSSWNGYWDFCGSGHIEEAETASQAVARECLEEVGIVVHPQDARFLHVMHSVWAPHEPTYCDFYFAVERYEGTPYPAEPDKCADMRWWPVHALPEGMIPLRRTAMERILQGLPYSEHQVLAVRPLKEEEITRELFAGFQRRQVAKCCRRWTEAGSALVEAPFVEEWSEQDDARVLEQQRRVVSTGGIVLGAWMEGAFKGFVSVEAAPMGPGGIYRDVTSMYVSEEMRRQGIGRVLFHRAAEWARNLGAQKLYISAHSSEETQAFYRAMGCVDALYVHPQHAAEEPLDCPLEYLL